MMGCEIEKCLPERTEFRSIVLEPIQELMSKKKKQEANDCLKYYTFWSILHGLISMKNMRGVGVSDEINKMVMDDAIDGFIKKPKLIPLHCFAIYLKRTTTNPYHESIFLKMS